MKQRVIMFLIFVFGLISFNASGVNASTKKKWFDKDSRIEVVNEKTVIFKNVVKIEIMTTDVNQITYVYDLRHSKLIKVARGSFEVNLVRGDYLIQSDKKITKTVYEVIIE